MPGAIIHLMITEKILKDMPKSIFKNENLVYAGALAPDAIHAKVDYEREDKRKTHLRTAIRDAHFHYPENLKLFHNRVDEFIEKHITGNNKNVEFYMGYLFHLFTDELFILTVRREYSLEMNNNGFLVEDKDFFKSFIEDIDIVDNRMLKHFDNKIEILNKLQDVEVFDVEDLITKEQLLLSKEWIIKTKFTFNGEIKETNFITEERVLDFINYASSEIITRLSNHKNINLIIY